MSLITIAGRECSCESLFDGDILCAQPVDGYRFSMDPVLLGQFTVPAANDQKALDLGAGCGIISLILAHRYPRLRISALELQPALARIISHNIAQNKLHDRLDVINGDLRRIDSLVVPQSFDLVFVNPPYAAEGASRLSKNREKAIARRELTVKMVDVLAAAAYALRDGGRAAFIYPAARYEELLVGLRAENLTPAVAQKVHGYPGGPQKMVLVEAQKNGTAKLVTRSPMYIFSEPGGEYTAEMAGGYKR